MSKVEDKGLMPALRFPEFRDAEEWNSEKFDKIYSLKTTNSLSRDKLNYKKGTIKNIHYGDIHTKFSALFDIQEESVPYINSSESLDKIKSESYCQESDVIFADASEDMHDIGKSIEIVNLSGEKLLSGLHTLLARQIDKKLMKGFSGYLFQSGIIRKQIQREAQGTKVLGISAKRILSIDVIYPSDKNEQKKITRCLSSLDELITAQNQKLDTLKAYKKGLMQQLFPAEGKTVPKLRFPEFLDTENWLLEKFGEICKFVRGPFGGTLKKENFIEKGYAVYEQSHAIHQDFSSFRYYINKEKFDELKRFEVKPNDIIMSCSGTMGKFAVIPLDAKKGIINQALLKLTVKKNNDLNFVKYMLEYQPTQEKFLSQSAGGAIKNVAGVGQLKEIDLVIPSHEEQQKIANCLSSLDELITTQSQKIETLKAHKKGLMQQLFPDVGKADI